VGVQGLWSFDAKLMEGDSVMKRFTLLVSILTILAVTSPSTHASPVTFDSRIDAAMMIVYRLLVQSPGTFPAFIETFPGFDDRDDGRVGGDADDYANGRDGDPDAGGGEIDTNGGRDKLHNSYYTGSGKLDPKGIIKAYGRR